ncbi:UPF0496 protein At1g20180-like isoform X2 [Tasmannia lanceolata]
MWSKIQGQLRRTNEERLPLSPLPSYVQISEYLIEPRQEALLAMINKSHLHALILDYFAGSLEAGKICGFLLESINQTRVNYSIIQRVLKLTKRVTADYTEEQCRLMFSDFTKFAKLENPLSGLSRVQFHQIHEVFESMLKRLTSTRKKIQRRAKVFRFCKKSLRICLIAALGGIVVATIFLAAHTCVGIATTPIVISSSTKLLKRKIRSLRRLKLRSLTRLGAQLDAAARGAYILNRDFDTMSRLITRLNDEIEHSNAMISICMKNKTVHLLEEVVKELKNNKSCFLEQLEELEEHVYLCFLTINRGRRLLIQEIVVHQ